jgi:DNA-binding helix-hairpin-helix protein with protein kinase domain
LDTDNLRLLLVSLQWRYAVGEDREALIKVTRVETDEDKAAKEKVHQIKDEEGNVLKLKVDKLLGRRKLKKDYEYEVGAASCCVGSAGLTEIVSQHVQSSADRDSVAFKRDMTFFFGGGASCSSPGAFFL